MFSLFESLDSKKLEFCLEKLPFYIAVNSFEKHCHILQEKSVYFGSQ